MKNLKILAGLLIAYALNSCGILPDVLPDETQSGKNTFGCLINGKVFKADKVTGDISTGVLEIYALKDVGSGISIGIENINPNGIGTYFVNKRRYLLYTDGKCWRGQDDIPINTSITITKFERGEDKPKNLRWLIVSGRFEGILPPAKGCNTDTTKITQGRFDIKLQ